MAHHIYLTDDLPLAYFLYNSEYEVIDCNRAAVNIFARDKGRNIELVRTYLISQSRYIYPNFATNEAFTEQVIRGACAQALAEGVFHFEHTFLTLSGEAIPCAVTIVPIILDSGQGYVHYLRDLHDHQRITEEIKKRKAAEEALRTKSRFLARMSHEIRTPMHAVLGIAELLMQKDDLSADVYEALAHINSASGLLMATVDDLLDLARVESGKLEINNQPYETFGMIIDTVQLNQVHRRKKKLTFNVHVDESLPVRFIGDERRIRQVLNNLLSNAFKYTQVGMVSLSFAVEITPDGQKNLRFVVKDTGLGLTPQQVENLFDAENNSQTQTHIAGPGLGMFMVKQLLDLMQGQIDIVSAPNKGTEITVRIPQQTPGTEVLGAELAAALQDIGAYRSIRTQINRTPAKQSSVYAPMPYARVLVVDDVESNMFAVRSVLEHYGITVDVASDGAAAVELIRSGQLYDIIFMDQMMPIMGGAEAAALIRERGYTRPIIAVTANIMDKISLKYKEMGFDGFLAKPMDVEQIEECITQYIRNRYSDSVFVPAPAARVKPTVMIVDDSPGLIVSLSNILQPHYNVLAVKNGKSCGLLLGMQKVDLILLDIFMPEETGFDVLKDIRAQGHDMPVIIISSSDNPQDHVQGMALGAVDFLRKPLDEKAVLQRVALHVGGTAARKEQ